MTGAMEETELLFNIWKGGRFIYFRFGCTGLSLVAGGSCYSCRAQAPLVVELRLRAL